MRSVSIVPAEGRFVFVFGLVALLVVAVGRGLAPIVLAWPRRCEGAGIRAIMTNEEVSRTRLGERNATRCCGVRRSARYIDTRCAVT